MKLGHHLTQKNDSHFFEEDLPLVFGTNKMGSKFTRLHSNCVWNHKSFFRFFIRKYLQLRNFEKSRRKFLIKKETLAQIFSCEFCEISKKTFF